MKKALGYIATASYGKTKDLPKDYFDSYVSEKESKYITLLSTFKFKEYFEHYGHLPLLVIENEVEPVSKEDLGKMGTVNVFLRRKFESHIKFEITMTERKELL